MKFQRILTVENEPGKPEKVPGMTGKAYLRKIPLGEAKALVESTGMEGFSKILELSLCDQNGESLPNREIEDLPFDAGQALATLAIQWNGLSGKAQDALEKNSEASQQDD